MFISLDIVLDTKMFVLEVVSSVLCVGCTSVLISFGMVTIQYSPSLSGLVSEIDRNDLIRVKVGGLLGRMLFRAGYLSDCFIFRVFVAGL